MRPQDHSVRLRRLLVIEDSTQVLDRIRNVFRGWHRPASLHYAFSLADAERFLSKTEPDLLITSRLVQGGDVMSALAGAGTKYPVIVLLADAKERDELPALSQWVGDYLLKTHERLEELPHIVERLLREWRHIQQKEQLQRAVDAVSDFVGTASKDGRMLFINSAGRTMMGIGEDDEISGVRLHELFPNWSIDTLLSDQISSAVPGDTPLNKTTRLSRQEGRDIRGAVLAHLSASGEIEHFTIVGRPTTTADAAQRDVQQSLRLETIGKLAAGIAHDLNNALTPILGQAELGLSDVEKKDRSWIRFNEILRAGKRARELVRQVVSFGSPTSSTRRAASIESLISEAINVARAALPSSVRFEELLAKECGDILAEPPQIYQLVVSLCLRCAETMKPGARLTVCLDRLFVDKRASEGQPVLRPGLYAHLSIIGAPAEEEQEIGDPIDLPPDRVLDEARRIAVGHGGGLAARGYANGRSTVEVFLPVVEESGTTTATSEPPDAGAGRILLVDDEDAVTKTVDEVLRKQGYSVTIRHDGTDALRTFCSNPDGFDLVITDQTMPEMGGETLATRLRRVRPDVPVILTTGHNYEPTPETMRNLGVRAFLRKPFELRQLKAAVREALGDR